MMGWRPFNFLATCSGLAVLCGTVLRVGLVLAGMLPAWEALGVGDGTPPKNVLFIAVGFRLPHVPCFATQRWFDLYPEDGVILPPVKVGDRTDGPAFSWHWRWKLAEPRLPRLQPAGQWRPLVRAYLASTSCMDSQVGRVLAALDSSGLAARTVVVLWSEPWRHICDADGSEELCDHRLDPHEWSNAVSRPGLAGVFREHARWLLVGDVPAVPGRAHQVLIRREGRWFWEGQTSDPSEPEPDPSTSKLLTHQVLHAASC